MIRLTRFAAPLIAALLAACAPPWMAKSSDLIAAGKYDDAYAIASDAQAHETSPQNYMAAFFAGCAAYHGDQLDVAEEHLQFAATAIETNPSWVQYRSWEIMAFCKVRRAFQRFKIGRAHV